MIDNNELLYMVAHIGNKKLKYKWIKEHVQLPHCTDNTEVEFKIVVQNDASELSLIFYTDTDTVVYTEHIGGIMEAIYRGTNTEHVIFSDAVFTVDEFNFDAMKEEGALNG